MINKKIIRNIILAVLVIGILVATLIYVQKMPDQNDVNTTDVTEENEELDSSIAEDIAVLDILEEDVEKITIKNVGLTYTIIRKEDGVYEMENSDGIPYSSSLLEGSFTSFLKINAQREVTEDNVGFTEKARATLTMKDGSIKEIILGNEVIGQSNQHFLKYDDKIYAVLSYVSTYFTAHSDSFREKKLGLISSDIKSVMIKKDGVDYVGFKKAETEQEANILDVTTSFVMTYPKTMPVHEDRLSPLYEKIQQSGYSIDVAYFVDNNIRNKGKYGIGKMTAVINDGSEEYVLEFGDKDENGYIYTVFNNGNFIFAMEPSLYDILEPYSPDYLMDKTAHLILISKINQVVIEGKGEKYTLDISGSEDNYTYKINKKDIEEDKFKEAYREIIGIMVDSMLDNPVGDMKGEYTVTFKYLDGKEAVYKYASYDDRNYVLIKDGKGEKILLKKRLPQAMQNIKKIITE